MEPFITIKIKPPVKHKLDNIRKDTHISEYIDQMLTFFEVTMTSPKDVQTYPLVEMRKNIHSLEKMLKGMERGILNAILADVKKLSNGQLSVTAPSEPRNQHPEVTNEMIIEVATRNEQLETQLLTEKEKVAQLSKELIQLKDELKNPPQCKESNIDQIEELFKWLKGSLRKAQFNDDYLIAGAAYKEFVHRLDNLMSKR